MSEAPEILTPQTVAELLKVSEQCVTKLARERKIKGFRIGRNWRFRRRDVDTFIEDQIEPGEAES